MPVFRGSSQQGVLFPKGTPIGAVSLVGADLNVSSYTRLIVLSSLVTVTAADLIPSVIPYDPADGTQFPRGLVGLTNSGSGLSGGSALSVVTYDVTGIDKVSVRVTNNGAGATTFGISYFLGT